MKAILVIDEMPKTCGQCMYHITEEIDNNTVHYCLSGIEGLVDIKDLNNKPTWCPLKPLPQPKDEHTSLDNFNWELESIINAENRGYNRLLEELLGEEE